MGKQMKKLTAIAMILSALIAMAAGIWLGQTSNQQTQTLKPAIIQGAIFPQAKYIEHFELIDQNKNIISKHDFQNHWSLVFVGYTNCPDICPMTLSVMNQVIEYMSEQLIQPPQIVFLSVDPERDTPLHLKRYVEYFNKDFLGLTGSLQQVTQLSQNMNAVFRKAPGLSGEISSEDYLIDHSSALMLINPQGNLQSILTAPHTPGSIIESIIQSKAYYGAIQ